MQDWLTNINIKFYESKINLNWKPILKSIMEVAPCCYVLIAQASSPVLKLGILTICGGSFWLHSVQDPEAACLLKARHCSWRGNFTGVRNLGAKSYSVVRGRRQEHAHCLLLHMFCALPYTAIRLLQLCEPARPGPTCHSNLHATTV